MKQEKPPPQTHCKVTADQLRARAKQGLCNMFGISQEYSSPDVDQIVDDIISVAILETAELQRKALSERKGK